MRKRYIATICLLIAGLAADAAPRITSAKHDPAAGVTTLVWQDDRPAPGYAVFRSHKPLTEKNMRFAERAAVTGKTDTVSFPVRDSGKSCYLVCAMDASRRVRYELTEHNVSAFLDETDRTAPAPVALRLQDGFLRWTPPPREDGVRELCLQTRPTPDAAWRTVRKLPATRNRTPQLPVTGLAPGEYALSAADAAGNVSLPGATVHLTPEARFEIASQNTVRDNPDFATAARVGCVGRANRFQLTVHNSGGKAGRVVGTMVLTDMAAARRVELPPAVADIPPYGTGKLMFDWTPDAPGFYQLEASLTPGGAKLSIPFAVTAKPCHIVWYADSSDLEWVTIRFGGEVEEARRRGIRLLGVVARPSVAKLAQQTGHPGFQLDELNGVEDEKYVAQLREYRKNNPEAFVAVWKIGWLKEDGALAEAIRDGTIDLFLPEVYLMYGEPLKKLEIAIECAQKLKISEKTVIGLGVADMFAGFSTPEEQGAFLEKQIKLIRERAPEMPGAAFFNCGRPEVRKIVDQLCVKYFLQNNQKESGE